MKWHLSVNELLDCLDCPGVEGDFDGRLSGISDLRKASEGELSFLSSPRYTQYLKESRASVVLVPEDIAARPRTNQLFIRCREPSVSLARVCRMIERQLERPEPPGVHPTAVIAASAKVDPGASIGPFCVIDEEVTLEAGAVLDSHVRIERNVSIGRETRIFSFAWIGRGCRIGAKCRLFSGVAVGSDGFGYHSDETGHHLLPQIGTVVIEDNVDVGANTTIDRARFAETRIGEGTRIDNLVQIGHNVIIGKHCILCAQAGLAGSAELGNFVVLAGQVGVVGHVKLGDGVTATGQCGISKDIPAGTVVGGSPAQPHREEMRQQAYLKRLPGLIKRIKALEDR